MSQLDMIQLNLTWFGPTAKLDVPIAWLFDNIKRENQRPTCPSIEQGNRRGKKNQLTLIYNHVSNVKEC